MKPGGVMRKVRRAKHPALGLLLALWAVLAVACGAEPTKAPLPIATAIPAAATAATPPPTASIEPVLVPTLTATPVPTPTPGSSLTATPAPTPTPAPAAAPSPPTAAQIFARISPSLAFIETASGTGSGVLIEGGFVLTNAHVVWPFEKVRVTFPDGSEFQDAPVIYTDPLGDIALIGPINTSREPLELLDGEDLLIGSEVFLLGYPAEEEEFPQPTITRGILSRFREWEALGMTYFQTDAAIAGGQSGGVLVSDAGEIIGISGFSLSEAGFGLVASAADLLPRIDGLLLVEDVSGLGDREVPFGGGRPEQTSTLDSFWDFEVYVVNNPVGETIDLKVDGESDLALYLVDVFGNFVIQADSGFTGIESSSAKTTVDAPHFALVTLAGGNSGSFQLSSNRSLAAFHDPDDGKKLAVGETIRANMDYPFDFDYFLVDLGEGDTVDITVDTMNFDALLQVDYLGSTGEVFDDDSGGGIFGTNAKITFRAPESATYTIVVQDFDNTGVGGYFLTVAQAPPGAVPFPIAPPAATVDSPFGLMEVYESAQYPFSIQHPAGWTSAPEEGVTAQFAGPMGEVFGIAEEDILVLGLGDLTLAGYVDVILSVVESNTVGFELLSQKNVTTAQGLPAVALEMTFLNGQIWGRRYVVVYDSTIGFSATYVAPKDKLTELEPLIDYSFSTFQVTEVPVGTPTVIPSSTPIPTVTPPAVSTPTPSSVTVGGRTFNQYSQPPLMTIDPAATYTAIIRTGKGVITLELFASEAPITVNNFVFLAREGFYDGVIFHRVIRDFMIQTGDPTGTGTGGSGYLFKDEPVTRSYSQGIVAMANSGPDTNGSQFFIVHGTNVSLPPAYTIFGQVTLGMDTVDELAKTAVRASATGELSVPTETLRIQSIEITTTGAR